MIQSHWLILCCYYHLITQAFLGGGYRLGAAPEEESAYVSGERRGAGGAGGNQQDVSVHPDGLFSVIVLYQVPLALWDTIVRVRHQFLHGGYLLDQITILMVLAAHNVSLLVS